MFGAEAIGAAWSSPASSNLRAISRRSTHQSSGLASTAGSRGADSIELRRLVDMVGVARGVDAHDRAGRIVAQRWRDARGDLGPGRAIGEIGLGAEQRLPVLAGERGGAARRRANLLAQHQPVGAVNLVGGGQGAPKILEQALFQRRAEFGLAPQIAGDLRGLAAYGPGRRAKAPATGRGGRPGWSAEIRRNKRRRARAWRFRTRPSPRRVCARWRRASRDGRAGRRRCAPAPPRRHGAARKVHSTAARTSGSLVVSAASPESVSPSR